jgi:TRAP-type C4-dicarboxylate transport system permease small subunit
MDTTVDRDAPPGLPLRALLALDRWVTGLATALAGAALMGAVSLAFYQVLMRYVFNRPTAWTEPILQLLVVWMVYLGLAATFRAGALVSVDLLLTSTRGLVRRTLEATILLLCLVLLAHMVWYGSAMVQRGASNINPVLGFAMSWGYLAVPVGGALATLAAVARFFDPRSREPLRPVGD